MREKGVEYLNKLGKFVGPNTLELVDKKGNVTQKTAARLYTSLFSPLSSLLSSRLLSSMTHKYHLEPYRFMKS